jgi:predicted HicB family RNase H-like nuclease
MAQTSKAIREAYNTKTYRSFTFRVRKNSELCERMEKTVATPGASLNYLIAKLLAEHYNVPLPEAHNDND